MPNILVVDDEAICREPITEAVAKHGYKVRAARDGQEALALCRDQLPDLILLDVIMPGMDGLEVLRILRRNPQWLTIPVILLTNAADRGCVWAACKLGIQGYLLKSHFSLSDLLARIESVLENPRNAMSRRKLEPAAAGAPAHPGVVAVAGIAGATQVETGNPPPPPSPVRRSTSPGTGTLNREMILRRLEEMGTLRTLPGSVAEVIAIASSPRASRAELAAALGRDPVWATRVLRLSNSTAYAASRPRAHSVDEALSVVGFDAVRNLAATIGIFDAMPSADSAGLGAIRCWQHSLAVATLMDRLAPKDGADIAHGVPHLVGLCHDLGEIALRQYFSQEYQTIIDLAAETQQPYEDLEAEILGLRNTELTNLVLAKLGLPDSITAPIREFPTAGHAPGSASVAPMAEALRISNLYAHGILLASGPESSVSPILRSDMERAGLKENIGVDVAQFRCEILTSTNLLARPAPRDESLLNDPILPRNAARVWYACPATFSDLDPLHAALQLLAQVDKRPELPQSADAARAYDAIVVAAPPAEAPNMSHTIQLLAALAKPSMLLGADAPPTESGARINAHAYPVTLHALANFISEAGTRLESAPSTCAS